jgi:hypothetical protein
MQSTYAPIASSVTIAFHLNQRLTIGVPDSQNTKCQAYQKTIIDLHGITAWKVFKLAKIYLPLVEKSKTINFVIRFGLKTKIIVYHYFTSVSPKWL